MRLDRLKRRNGKINGSDWILPLLEWGLVTMKSNDSNGIRGFELLFSSWPHVIVVVFNFVFFFFTVFLLKKRWRRQIR